MDRHPCRRTVLDQVEPLFGIERSDLAPAARQPHVGAGGRIVGAGDLADPIERDRVAGDLKGLTGPAADDLFFGPRDRPGDPGDHHRHAGMRAKHPPAGPRQVERAAQDGWERLGEEAHPLGQLGQRRRDQPGRQRQSAGGAERASAGRRQGRQRRRGGREKREFEPAERRRQIAALPRQHWPDCHRDQ